jgi:hydrogenase maturation protease
MKDQKTKTLILGIGNDILKDDGIGPRLVNDLRPPLSPLRHAAELALPPAVGGDIDFKSTTLGGLDILEFVQGYERVIFIDAIKTKGGVPGTVYQFTPQDFQETLHLSNLHDVSFLEAIELGKRLGFQIPKEMHIIAVEIVEDMEFGTEFTPILKEKYPRIVEEVAERIGQLLTVDG